MAIKNQKRPNMKKEKGAFRKSLSEQTEYQKARTEQRARKKKTGNYGVC